MEHQPGYFASSFFIFGAGLGAFGPPPALRYPVFRLFLFFLLVYSIPTPELLDLDAEHPRAPPNLLSSMRRPASCFPGLIEGHPPQVGKAVLGRRTDGLGAVSASPRLAQREEMNYDLPRVPEQAQT